MIKTILWDIDGTILNFQSAAENSLKNTFRKFGYGDITDELLHMYEGINDVYWCKLEKGKITKEKLLVERFVEFFTKIGVETTRVKEFNQAYLNGLLDTVVFMPEAYETVKKLHLQYKQYIVTNGVKQLQRQKRQRLKNSLMVSLSLMKLDMKNHRLNSLTMCLIELKHKIAMK